MNKMLLSLIVAVLVFKSSFAQIGFSRNTAIPVSNGSRTLSMPWAGGINYGMFSALDLNNDGLNDLMCFDRNTNRVTTFVNTNASGTSCWSYAPQYEDMFPAMNGWAILYDYNCDNKPDLLTTTFRNNGIMLFRNDTQGGSLVWTLVDTTLDAQSQFGPYNIFASSYLVPEFNDIDGDGDMDVLTQQFTCVGSYAYFRNRSMEDYGVCDSLDKYELVTNAWGRFAIRSGLFPQIAVQQFNINCQSMSPPENSGYEVARRDDTFANIFTIDIDGDGDKDALIGDSQTDNSLLVINGGTPGNAMMVSQDTAFPSNDVPVRMKSFTMHSYFDADNDGVKDLIVGQSEYRNYNSEFFYKNNGTNSLPVFNLQQTDFLQNEMIDVGEGSSPAFFDEDGDGLKDLIIGNRRISLTDTTGACGLTLYRNTGTATQPAYTFVTDDYLNLRSQNYNGTLNLAFGDLDVDGDEDLLIGLDDGRMNYLKNCSGPGQPANFCQLTPYFMSIDVGNACAPTIADMKRDGLPDLIIGNKNGILKYYENLGSAGIPFFAAAPTLDNFGQVNVQAPNSADGYADPFIFEYNGSFRLAVGNMEGNLLLYGNIDNNLQGAFTVLDTLVTKIYGNRYGYNLSVSGSDVNGDSLIDLVTGLYTGGVQIWQQLDTTSGIASLPGSTVFKMYPNPASDQLIIKSEINTATYKISDVSGRILINGRLHGGYGIVPVNELANGIYFVSVNNSSALKLIIAH